MRIYKQLKSKKLVNDYDTWYISRGAWGIEYRSDLLLNCFTTYFRDIASVFSTKNNYPPFWFTSLNAYFWNYFKFR